MKKLFFLLSLCIVIYQLSVAQNVGIGTTAPNASAQLDVSSATKGFLPPRMSATQRKAIVNPAAGLVVFDTDATQLFLFDGVAWRPLSSGGSGNSLYPSAQYQPAADQKSFGVFGCKVSLSGNYAVIGAYGADSGTLGSAGAAYVYKKGTSGAWTQVAKLYASDEQQGAFFGASVGISGNYIVVGAPSYSGGGTYYAGKVYVFVKGAGESWTQQAAFTAPSGVETSAYFGYNVAISATSTAGPTIIAGAPYADYGGTDRGAAYVFVYSSNIWVPTQTLQGADVSNSDNFGWEVDIDGDYLVAGAPEQNNPTYSLTHSGAAYIYVYGGGVWTMQQKLLGGYVTDEAFGSSLSLRGVNIVIGASGTGAYSNSSSAVYVYKRTLATWNYIQQIYLLPAQGYDATSRFGASVSIDNDLLLVGVPGGIIYHTGSITFSNIHSSVVVYKRGTSGYFYLNKLINDDEVLSTQTNLFGASVCTLNGNYVIGIPRKVNGNNTDAGGVVFGYLQ